MIINKLQKLLNKNGKTVYWLSKQTNVSMNTLYTIVNDEYKHMTISTLDSIIKVFDCGIIDVIEYSKD